MSKKRSYEVMELLEGEEPNKEMDVKKGLLQRGKNCTLSLVGNEYKIRPCEKGEGVYSPNAPPDVNNFHSGTCFTSRSSSGHRCTGRMTWAESRVME